MLKHLFILLLINLLACQSIQAAMDVHVADIHVADVHVADVHAADLHMTAALATDAPEKHSTPASEPHCSHCSFCQSHFSVLAQTPIVGVSMPTSTQNNQQLKQAPLQRIEPILRPPKHPV
jgi:hypothetical protein